MNMEELQEIIASGGAVRHEWKFPPTIIRFMMADDVRFRIVLGPFGSGKTYGCFHEILDKMSRQSIWMGKRRSRWYAVRNTFVDLEETTIRTFVESEIFPPGSYTLRMSSPPTAKIFFRQPANSPESGDPESVVEAEIVFLAMDKPDDERKLKGLEATGLYFNELSELKLQHVTTAMGRLGRFPKKRSHPRSGKTIFESAWQGAIADSNLCEEGHWMHEACEVETPSGWRFFRQPGALVETSDGRFVPNFGKAENIGNLTEGFGYYLNNVSGWLLGGKNRVRVFACAQWASLSSGKPVFENAFSSQLHVSQAPLEHVPGAQLLCGMDFGLTPAAIFMQYTGGHLNVIDEVIGDNVGVYQFMYDFVLPFIAERYPQVKEVLFVGDPAGGNRHETTATASFDEIRKAVVRANNDYSRDPSGASHAKFDGTLLRRSVSVVPAPQAWAPLKVQEAGRWAMGLGTAVRPSLRIDKRCKVLIRALGGQYRFRKLQVSGTERFSDRPEKDEFSHPAEAFCYACAWLKVSYASLTGGRPRMARGSRAATPVHDAELGF